MVNSQSSLVDHIKNLDKIFFLSIVLLVGGGIFIIYSAGGGDSGIGKLLMVRQLFWALISGITFFAVILRGYKWFLEWAYPLYGLSLALLLLVLLTGSVTKGAQSWLALGPFHLQPSEFGKIAFALALSKFMARNNPQVPRNLLKVLLLASPALVLVLFQPDLGSTVVYSFMLLAGIILAGGINRYVAALFGGGLALLPLGWQFLKEYQKKRITVFLNPAIDPLGAGYNVIQSRIAVGSGGLWGKGYLKGLQSKLHFLPEPHTDFIFSVYAEEFGFAGASILILVLVIVLWRIIKAGRSARDLRAKYFVQMVASWLFFQSMECIAMSIGLMPVTGIPFPFISYGGSSLLAICLSLGIVSSIQLSSIKLYR